VFRADGTGGLGGRAFAVAVGIGLVHGVAVTGCLAAGKSVSDAQSEPQADPQAIHVEGW
jgi:hypothetical protein